jgi:hypothetical protein
MYTILILLLTIWLVLLEGINVIWAPIWNSGEGRVLTRRAKISLGSLLAFYGPMNSALFFRQLAQFSPNLVQCRRN